MKMIVFCGLLAVAILVLGSCADKLDIKKNYDFTLSTWFLQSGISLNETVEIRFTLRRSGVYEGAEYFVGYVQTEGKGELSDREGMLLENREQYELKAIPGLSGDGPEQTFTLFYKCTSDKKRSRIKIIVSDNFGQEHELPIEFEIEAE